MSDAIVASDLFVENCEPDCACQSVHLALCDAENTVFGVACMLPEVARIVAAKLLAKADLADAQAVKNAGRLA